jgi:predicted aspartyl protease
MTRRACIGLGLVALLAACAHDPNDCYLERAAEMPVRMASGAILVPVRIDGTATEMMLDTGASSSLLSEEAAPRLGLAEDNRQTLITGVGGAAVSRHARVRSLEVGGQTWTSLSLPIVRLAHKFTGAPLPAGILGADRLSEFDVELDFPHGQMRLWHVAHCGGDFVRWSLPHYVVPLARHSQNQMIAPAEINGHKVTALVDWGAAGTTVTGWFTTSLGVTPEMLASDRLIATSGLDQSRLPTRVHRFEELRIGAEVFRHPTLFVADLHLHDVGMTLGANFVRRRRIWLSYATRQMFVVPPSKTDESPPVASTHRAPS